MPIGFILSGCIAIYILFFGTDRFGSRFSSGFYDYKRAVFYGKYVSYVLTRVALFFIMLLFLASYIDRYYVIYAMALSYILLAFYVWDIPCVYMLYSILIVVGYIVFNVFISTTSSFIWLFGIVTVFVFSNEYIMGVFTELVLMTIYIIIESGLYAINTQEYYFDVSVHIDVLMLSIVLFHFIYVLNKGRNYHEKTIFSDFSCVYSMYNI